MAHGIEGSYNFWVVSDKLTTSGVVGTERLKALASQGYDVVVNLLPDSSEHAVENERELVEAAGVEYIYIPVDFASPGRADLARFREALDGSPDKKIHVHCAANYRVSAFYSLYAAGRGDWSAVQATEFIQSVWQPSEYPAWSRFIDDVLGEIEQKSRNI